MNKLFVKKFRAGQVIVIKKDEKIKKNDEGSSGQLVLEDESSNQNPNRPTEDRIIESVKVENANELLHLASSYGDLYHMLMAFALDADRNAIVDKNDSNYACDDSSHQENGQGSMLANGYSHKGYTPLIKAILSVNFFIFCRLG